MYISKIRVKNYKSFLDSGDIEFKPGINIIVGQNNSGKTALLEVLELNFFDLPHKSEKSLPKQGQRLRNQASESEVTFKLIPKELNLIRADNEFSTIFLRMPIQNHSEHIETIIDKFNHSLDEGLNITIDLKSRRSNPESNAGFDSLRYGFYEPDPNPNRNTKYLALKISEEKKYQLESKTQHLPQGRSVFGLKLYKDFKRKIYRFHAERVNLGSCEAGLSRDLVSDCQNLAEVLQNTQTRNSWLYEEFNKYVSQVYDSVKWLNSISQTVSNAAGDEKQFQQIFIWNIDRKTEREDLAIPLSQCGTGIGQVLAILYIVVTSREPRTIIIDEPNSFLHPGAAKKLIQILNKFPQHQYFISTHSPEILSAAKPSTITRLKYIDGETIAESINLEQTKDLRETLDEIGVRFSDVFFSENILWVEGETEEKAFPLILEKTDRIFDVAILPLVHTDDLRERKSKGRKHAKLVFEIYKRLSGANALTPPFVAVILDKESANEQEFKELEKIGGDKLKFIPRKMYENYLIDANAIANVLNNEIIENENKLSVEQVNEWISEQRKAMFLSEKETGKEILEMSDWIETVHAAELLAKLFSGLSAKTVEYRKTTHSVKLTEWLLENKPEQLAELKDFLLKILSAR